jgi:hypothetical protein
VIHDNPDLMAIPATEEPASPRTVPAIAPRELVWWLPVALAVIYVLVAVLPNLHSILDHTWWAADSAAAGFIGQLYHSPPPGQYAILGDHGWYETAAFYVLTRALPAHRAIWYLAPVVFWISTIALVATSTARAFGRYYGALVAAAMMCLAPTGLMVVFQPTAHSNSLLHAAVLALVSVYVLPRVCDMSVVRALVLAVALGAFSGLGAAGDALSLVWGVLPFVVTVGIVAWRGPVSGVWRTLAFGAVTLLALLIVSTVFTAIMRGAGFRIDELASKATQQFTTPAKAVINIEELFQDIQYLVGGDFFSKGLNFHSILQLIIAMILFVAAGAVVFVTRKAVVEAGARPDGGAQIAVTPRLVHVSFWMTCLLGGLLVFVIGTPGVYVSRYLLGPLVAIIALLPLAAIRGYGWRLAIVTGVSAVAIIGLVRVSTLKAMPSLPLTKPLAPTTVRRLENFAAKEHVTSGYAQYWDAMTLSWFTGYRLQLFPIGICGHFAPGHFCARYQSALTDAYVPRSNTRTMFVADPASGLKFPDSRWGLPIASKQFGRLTAYVYPYDIASRMPPTPGDVQSVITGTPMRPGA